MLVVADAEGDEPFGDLSGLLTPAVGYQLGDRHPPANALFGVGIVVHDRTTDTVLVGRSARFDNLYELAGGKRKPGEDLRTTVARELAEETGLTTDPQTVRLVALLVDDRSGLPRTTIAAATRGAGTTP